MQCRYKLDAQVLALKSKTLPNVKFFIIKEAKFEMSHLITVNMSISIESSGERKIPDLLACEVMGGSEEEMMKYNGSDG